jgi:hypothetical protein
VPVTELDPRTALVVVDQLGSGAAGVGAAGGAGAGADALAPPPEGDAGGGARYHRAVDRLPLEAGRTTEPPTPHRLPLEAGNQAGARLSPRFSTVGVSRAPPRGW